MPRVPERHYQRRSMAAVVVYVAIVMLARAPAREATSLPLQMLYALLPVVPMIYVIWLLAQRIRASDELEQRTHLIGLGVATGVVAIISLIGGFLAAGKILSLQGAASFLLFIFPLLLLVYTATRAWVARRYGIDALCDDDGVPAYQKFLIGALLLAAVAVWVWLKGAGDFELGMLAGMAAVLAVAALLFGLRRWRRRNARRVEP
jgi:hypothetical protein